MKPIRLFLLLILVVSSLSATAQNGKKIYADYHGVRYTRQHDGKLGRWEMHASTEKSKTGQARLCYNADFVLENGRHDLAVTAYPQLGLQSNLDPEFIEYQILSAKAAGIDGFFIEWGFMGHENDLLLQAMQREAQKYDFEIGVNWCDGWIYYNWVTKMHPEIQTREQKTEYYGRCYQYLIDHVLTGPTAPIVKGQPVIYHFGGGAKPHEWIEATKNIQFKEGQPRPHLLRRWAEWGKLVDDRYEPVKWSKEIEAWKQLGMTPTAWLPARVRPRDAAHPNWDNYATSEDLIEFMKPFRDSIWMKADDTYKIKSGFVMPGMDNHGCAGWGRHHFFLIPRNEGRTYEEMWQFNMASKDSLDMMFIASWSDYTEGHEIEPTIENGDRELRTTLHYAAQFKDMKEDASGLELPKELFLLRKRCGLFSSLNRKTKPVEEKLDEVAQAISKAQYDEARHGLQEAKTLLEPFEKKLKTRVVDLKSEDLHFSHDAFMGEWYVMPELKLYLPEYTAMQVAGAKAADAYIEFEYFDEGNQKQNVYAHTEREPKDQFSTVASFYTNSTNQWVKVRLPLHHDVINYDAYESFALMFKGRLKIRNVSMHYELYK